jgi:hypothetical protein
MEKNKQQQLAKEVQEEFSSFLFKGGLDLYRFLSKRSYKIKWVKRIRMQTQI